MRASSASHKNQTGKDGLLNADLVDVDKQDSLLRLQEAIAQAGLADR